MVAPLVLYIKSYPNIIFGAYSLRQAYKTRSFISKMLRIPVDEIEISYRC